MDTNFDDLVAAQAIRGRKLPLSGTFSGVKVAYLPTERDFGVMIEIFSGKPKKKAKGASRTPKSLRRRSPG